MTEKIPYVLDQSAYWYIAVTGFQASATLSKAPYGEWTICYTQQQWESKESTCITVISSQMQS